MRIIRILVLSALMLALAATALAEVPMPDELKQFPVYKGAVVQQSMNMGQGILAILQLPEGATAQGVLGFFKDYFKKAGWNTDIEMNQESGGTLSYSKGDERAMINVDVSVDDTGVYSIVYSKRQ